MREDGQFAARRNATRVAPAARGRATRVTLRLLAAGLCAAAGSAGAASIELRVVDRDGRGVPDVVLVAAGHDASRAASHAPATAVMDQKDRKFVPQVLVVQSGTVVSFPNNDTVSHQVYSFSATRRFQLPLYKGEAHSPVLFDKAGLVVLGCNIHDEMVGYIYVTDSPYFARTGADGRAEITGVPAGQYRIEAWGPRVADRPEALDRDVTATSDGAVTVEWRLQQPLRPRMSPGPRDVDWDY
jgi:plastocyanin